MRVPKKLQKHCDKKLDAENEGDATVKTWKSSCLLPDARGFSALNMKKASFWDDRGMVIPSTSGLWNLKTSTVINPEDMGSVWNFEREYSLGKRLRFVSKVFGISDVLETDSDIEDAKNAHGGMGKMAEKPKYENGKLCFWSRGETGMCGTNFSHHQVKFPSSNKDGFHFC